VVIVPELDRRQRKMSTDLDADSDIINDADVSVDIAVETPVDVGPSGDGPYVKTSPAKDPSRDEYVKMELPEQSTPFLNNVEINVIAPIDSSESDTSSTRSDVELDGEIASRGSIDMADPRFHDARYDGSFDLRFAGLSRGESVKSDDTEDDDVDVKPEYEVLESEEDSNVMDVGRPPYLKAEVSLDSVEELNLDLAYRETFKPEDPSPGVDTVPRSFGVKGELDIPQSTDTLDVDPFESQFGNDVTPDVIPDHVVAVIDADCDGGLIHVQDGNINADVDIPGGEMSFGVPEENIGGDSAPSSFSEKVDSKRSEPKRRISRKCSKLGQADHVCSHVPKERKHSRSESSSSLCSTCTSRSAESSSPTFSRSYSSSGSDTEKDVKDIEDEDDEVGPDINGETLNNSVGISGGVELGHNLEGDVSNRAGMSVDAEIDVDTGLQINAGIDGDAMLSAPAGFADEVNIGAEDPDDDIDFGGGLPKSTGLNLKVELGLGSSV
jgi:hypothetical protein